jgi:carboxylesterase type B
MQFILQSNLEVMVWFHGGLLHYGSGHTDNLRPNGKLSRDSNFVFVSFNYRLQAMGFLALDLLANSGANSSFGNYGIWDSMIVLEWIQRNIHSFGGDPRKVTLFGSDGGSAMIMALMTNPDSRSLFRSVWLIDPALYFNRTFNEASNYNHNNFLSRSGCNDIDCLYRLSAQSVLTAFIGDDDPSFVIKDQNDLPIQGMFNKQLIVIDGEY